MRTMINIVVSSAAMLAVPRVSVWTRARLTVRCAGLGAACGFACQGFAGPGSAIWWRWRLTR